MKTWRRRDDCMIRVFYFKVVYMALRMFDALLPYFGNKRRLSPVMFRLISEYLPRDQ